MLNNIGGFFIWNVSLIRVGEVVGSEMAYQKIKIKLCIMKWLFNILMTFSIVIFAQQLDKDILITVDTNPIYSVDYQNFIRENFKLSNSKDSICKLLKWRFLVKLIIEYDGSVISTKIINKTRDSCMCELYQKEIFLEISRVMIEYHKVNVWKNFIRNRQTKKSYVAFMLCKI